MKTLARLVGAVVVVVLATGPARPADTPKPITEADLLKLVELKIPDPAIVDRVTKGGVEFAADEAVYKRLQKAGASDAVVGAVKKVAKPAPASVLSLWVQKDYGWDNALHSELSINGKSLGTFSSDTDRPVGEYLKEGWNTLTLKTTARPGATQTNDLIFRIGPVQKKKDGQRVMNTVWEFRNGTDWKRKDDKYTHQLGPDVKEVTLTYKVYYAGLEAEGRALRAGDYVLQGEQDYGWNSPVTATVWVNGQAFNTFLGGKRQLVITPYLRQGKNTIKVVSQRVPNVLATNNVKCWVGGPAEYNVTKGRYELKPEVQFEAMHGWKRDNKSGQLTNTAKAGSDTIERDLEFTLDHEPGKK
jgi:hypothetical protein